MAASRVTVDPRQPDVRLELLLDAGSSRPLHEPDHSGVLAMRGSVGGTPVVTYCSDARVMGGAMGAAGSQHIVDAIERAVRERVPVVGLWHSGGARLADGVESMEGVGRMFAAMTHASGRVPQISVVLGPAAGAAAYGPALTDIVIMTRPARMFITGPDVVHAVTGEHIDMESLGGPDTHARRSGVAHIVVSEEYEAFDRVRQLVDLLARPGRFARVPDQPVSPSDVLPESARRAYDVRPLLRLLLDPDTMVELQPRWANNVVVGFGRLAGGTVGLVANNPLHKGGCLDALSAEKASRFVRSCNAFGIPLLVVVDVPGYLPGVKQEWDGVIRRGAKLLHAFAECVVPRVTLITRKSYGGAYIAMNSRALGATAVFAWPDAEIAVMGAEAAVGILHRRRLAEALDEERETLRRRLVVDHQKESGGTRRALALGVIDEVIDPCDTVRRVAAVFAAAPPTRGDRGNIPL